MIDLDVEGRALVAAAWHARARGEARAVPAFISIGEDLQRLGAPQLLLEIACRAVDEEATHARLCTELAESYTGESLATPVVEYEPPRFFGAPTQLRPLLRVLFVTALSETLSSSFIETCRRAATAPPVRALFHALLEDEVDHARLGWATLGLPFVTDEVRGALGGYLPELVLDLVKIWRNAPLLTRHDLAGHGCLPSHIVDEHTLAALRQLVLPGFAAMGVDTAPSLHALDVLPAHRPTTELRFEDGRVRVLARD